MGKKNSCYKPGELKKIIVKVKSQIIKYQTKYDKINLKLKDLSDVSNPSLSFVKKLIKKGDKLQCLKIKLIRFNLQLKSLQRGSYKKQSLLKRFKRWFSNIRYDRQKMIWGLLFTLPWALGFFFFFAPSFITSIWWSFNSVSPTEGVIEISFIGLSNYVELLSSYVIDGATIFSVELYLFVQNLLIDLPIIIIFSILVAVLLNKKFKGHNIIKAIFFIPVIYNFTLITDTLSRGFGQYLEESAGADEMLVTQMTSFFLEIGIGQDLMVIVLQAVARIFVIVNLSGIQILIFVAAIQSIPSELYEAARMEGATKYEIFWKITIAMIMPLILTASIYTVVASFTRAPIFRFLDYSMVQNRYGLTAAISISYFLINIAIIGFIILALKGKVFYYDEK